MFAKFSIFSNVVDSLGFMDDSSSPIQVREDWGDRDVSGWQVGVPPSDSPSKFTWIGQGYPW